MKIIEQGALPEEKIYKVRCNNCSTLFEFKKHEAEYVSDQRDGDFLRVSCPFCKLTVIHSP